MSGPLPAVKKPLTLRLLKRILGFSVVLIALLAGARAWWDYHDALNTVHGELSAIEATMTESLAGSLWDYDREQLALHVEGIRRFRHINYVAVLDKDRIVAQAGVRRNRGVLERNFPLFAVHNGKRQNLGLLQVQADLQEVKDLAFVTALQSMAYEATLIILVAGLVFWLTSVMISRHLAAFAQHLQSFSLGVGSPPLNLDKKPAGDELDVLAQAVNVMQDGLVAAYAQVLEAQTEVRSLARFPQESPSPILRAGTDGLLLKANPASEALLALLGVQEGQRLPEPYASVVASALASGEVQHFEIESGGQFFAFVARPVPAEHFVNLYGMDITARKRAEEALKRQVLALTQPLEGLTSVHFTDLFNLEDIQRIQDTFAQSMNVASIITTPDGVPLTRPSHFCRLCRDIIRKTEKGLANCFASDAELGRPNPSGPTIQPCLSGGLWDAGASINVGGRHIANWLIGQVRNEAQNDETLLRYADEIGADREEFARALAEVPVMSSEQFGKVAKALFLLSSELSLRAYQNVQQARFIHERQKAEDDVRRMLARQQCLVRVLQHDAESVQEFLDFGLSQALELTGSRYGYIYHYSEQTRQFVLNTWSSEVMDECAVKGAPEVYELEKTGIWGEVVRQRKPIVLNDFHAPHPLKRGYPEGHVPLVNFMSVPVLREGGIVAVAGVGNKNGDYLDQDVRDLTLFMDACWQVVGRLDAEDDVLRSLHEKEIMLKEIHHRVKNNLQLISSLLFLQAEYVQDPSDKAMFEESQKRISAMALVHEELYGSKDLSSVGMGEFVPRLVDRVVASADVPVRVDYQVDDVRMEVTRSIPCGLILNELVMNAVKHAFRGGREALLRVELSHKGGELALSVEDNGPGLPEHFNLEGSATLGLTLVTSLARQLAGSVVAENHASGARFTLRFPLEENV